MNHEEKRQRMIKSKFSPNEFYFDCPFCNQRLLVDASLHNTITTCPTCNNEIVPIMYNSSQAMPTKKQTNVPSAVLQNFNGGHAVVNIYNQSGPAYTMYTKGKSRLTYILLGVFFGEIGIHNFYAGYTCEALVQLFAFIFLNAMVPGAGFFISPWVIANIICRNKDAKGNLFE